MEVTFDLDKYSFCGTAGGEKTGVSFRANGRRGMKDSDHGQLFQGVLLQKVAKESCGRCKGSWVKKVFLSHHQKQQHVYMPVRFQQPGENEC